MQIVNAGDAVVVPVDNSARRMERGCGSCQGYDSLECESRWEYFIDLDPPLFLIHLIRSSD